MHRAVGDLDPNDPDLEAILCFRLVTYIAQQMRYLLDRTLAADGLTTSQAQVIAVLFLAQPIALSLGRLAVFLGTSHQNAKKIASALVRKGYVTLEVDERDRRVTRLRPTDLARAHHERSDKPDHALVREVFSVLSERELAELRRILTKLEAKSSEEARAERARL